MELLQPLSGHRSGERPHDRLDVRAVERKADFRNPGRGREAAIVRWVVPAKRANIAQSPLLTSHDPVPHSKVWVRRMSALSLKRCLIEAGRQ